MNVENTPIFMIVLVLEIVGSDGQECAALAACAQAALGHFNHAALGGGPAEC
jgi:hypothetical protein